MFCVILATAYSLLIKIGVYDVNMEIPPFLLNANIYKVNLIFGENQRYALYKINDIISFEIENTNTGIGSNPNVLPGIIKPLFNWKVEFCKNLIN